MSMVARNKPLQLLIVSAAAAQIAAVLMGSITGCDRNPGHPQAHHASTDTINLAQRDELRGGDSRAWLTWRGDNADSGYCAARLKLPLEKQQAWVAEYTPAEFSQFTPRHILHRDGLLVVSALSTQIMGLDVLTGRCVFNRDVYNHTGTAGSNEQLISLFMHPAGLLVGADDLGRYYCWDLQSGEPDQLWISDETSQERSGFVCLGDKVITGWDGQLRALSVVDGSELWSYQTMLPAGGIVTSIHNVVIGWNKAAGEVHTLRASDGSLLWSVSTAALVWRVIIDDNTSRAYITTDDERVECRDLQSGDLRWEHDWSDLMPDEERERRLEMVGTNQGSTRDEGLVLESVAPIVMPGGICISLTSGDIVMLDHDGLRLWHYAATRPVISALAFENGILVGEMYLSPEYAGIFQQLKPFCLDPPDWERYRLNEDNNQTNVFFRIAVLDIKSGTVLDSCEFQRPAIRGPVPACNKIILDEMAARSDDVRRIYAYDWLEAEGN